MFSKVIPNSSIVRKGIDKELVSYALSAIDGQIVLSKDGILHLRSDKSGLIIDNSKSESTKKKEGSLFNKSNPCVELLFEFDKIYVCYNDLNFYLFCFTHTQDDAVIFTEMDINDFDRIDGCTEIRNFDELNEFLYEIDDSYGRDSAGDESFANNNPVTGKFIFSNGIDYARYYDSEVILKNPLSEFNKNQIGIKVSEFQTPKRYTFKVESDSSTEEVSEGVEENSKSIPFAEKILKTVQQESDFEEEIFGKSEEEFFKVDQNDERFFSITSTMRNYLIITGIDSLEIYDFYVFYTGEDSFKVEYQKLDIGSFSDVKRIFSNFQLK